MASAITQYLSSPRVVFPAAVLLRAALLVYGTFQDAHSPVKYTDIDYFVFTDAARYVSRGQSPYQRDTYRYTPILAWLLLPTAWGGWWFSFGKVLFALGDIVAGWLTILILRNHYGMPMARAVRFSCIWLLNPMVATISTRGSSEGLLGVIVLALLWAVLEQRIMLAGVLLGFGVHFKIYPFIYATSIIWWLDAARLGLPTTHSTQSPIEKLINHLNQRRIDLGAISLITFLVLNIAMHHIYGSEYLRHSWLHHFTRLDHRHNFSPYNIQLYLNSSPAATSSLHLESLAFIPQLFLSAIAIPLALAKKDLGATMLAQTFAFVTFNKVCTSQYFLWYLVFLPFYLPNSSLLSKPWLGMSALVLWVAGQAFWLQQGYRLEMLGLSSFVPWLWLSSILFFLINCWILGIVISDVASSHVSPSQREMKVEEVG
ncbi:glycosyltransferase family 50 protein [Rhizodiscina lignyota]|uniref:GPI mannosyltransferase 1 n=1 Tax=Rhizodiscina lignyota TaxID=1504668 RepID=A0A9P4IR29_9PEZI|nr:glycosyltransferase family 50 protein [Rhizodiscina lignyota]